MKTAAEIIEDLEYLYSRIDWGKSFLDARAIRIMNSLPDDIRNLEDKQNDTDIEQRQED